MLIPRKHSRPEFDGKWMVVSENGVYCGHNAVIFIKYENLRSYDCPTVFNSEQECKDFILQLRLATKMEKIENDESYHQFIPFSDRFMTMPTIQETIQ